MNMDDASFSANPISEEEDRLRQLLSLSEEERTRLEKMVELLSLKSEELSAKRSSFEEMESRLAGIESKLTKTEKRTESAEKIEAKITESERHFSQLDDFVRKTKIDIDGLNVLSEHVLAKTRSLNQQREIVEKSNEEAGKLNVLL
jgi:predicted  nucleic acid-binding Zn-ribbon protein